MKRIAIIFWSGTGNTEVMAKALSVGAISSGAEVSLIPVEQADIECVKGADAVALGCPAMGDEVLEEGAMEPFVATLDADVLSGKPLALFGSYDWGDGQWMRDWVDRMDATGAKLVSDGLIVNNTPGEGELASCRSLGVALVSAS